MKRGQARREKRLNAAMNLPTCAARIEPDLRAVTIAKRLYALRRNRDQMIGENLFGEPAWDMLLDLLICQADSRLVSVSSLCIGSGSSSTTALRYLCLMEERGLVQRIPDQDDGRRTFVRLTATGTIAISDVLLASGC